MNIKYENKYGTAELTLIEDYRPVRTIKRTDITDKSVFFSLDDSAKIALITDNRDIQLVLSISNTNECFVVHHKTGSLAAIAKIDMNFIPDINAHEEIDAIYKRTPRMYR